MGWGFTLAVKWLTIGVQFLFMFEKSDLHLETGVDNQILRTVSKPVAKIDKDLVKFVEEMKVAMVEEQGIGLAAPQVGRNIRVIIVRLDADQKKWRDIGMINPEIISFSEEKVLGQEGCLSIPGFFDEVERSKEIIVKFLDVKGNEQLLRLENLDARVVQHEVDHLDGILFVDRIEEQNKGRKPDMIAGAL